MNELSLKIQQYNRLILGVGFVVLGVIGYVSPVFAAGSLSWNDSTKVLTGSNFTGDAGGGGCVYIFINNSSYGSGQLDNTVGNCVTVSYDSLGDFTLDLHVTAPAIFPISSGYIFFATNGAVDGTCGIGQYWFNRCGTMNYGNNIPGSADSPYQAAAIFGVTVPTSTPNYGSVQWLYPTSSTVPTIDFSNWVLGIGGNPFTTYYVQVSYEVINPTNGISPLYNDVSSVSFGAQSSTQWAFPKSETLWTLSDGSSTSFVSAAAYLYSDANFTQLVASRTIQFYVAPSATSSQDVTSSVLSGRNITYSGLTGGVAPQYSCTFGGIFSSSSINDIGQCLVNVTNVIATNLFTPSTQAVTALQSQITLIQHNQLFGLFTNLAGVVQSYAQDNNSSTAPSSVYDSLSFNQSTTFLGNSPIVLLSSSSLASFIGEPAKEALFDDERRFLWILLGLLIALSVYHKVRHS